MDNSTLSSSAVFPLRTTAVTGAFPPSVFPVLLFVTTSVVLAANSNQSMLVELAANARFALYGALILIGICINRSYGHIPMGQGFSSMALVVLAFSSVVWSVTPALTFQRASGFALLLASAALISVRAWPDVSSIRRCFVGMSLAVTLCLSGGLILLAAGWPGAYGTFSGDGLRRLTGLLVNPNSIGVAAGLYLPILLGLRGSSLGGLSRPAYNIAITVSVVSLVLSQSRGGAVAAAVGVLSYAVFNFDINRARVAITAASLILALTAFFVIVPQAQPRVVGELGQRFGSPQPSAQGGSGRTAAWALAVDIWSERPVTGWGFGSAEVVFGTRAVEIEQVFVGGNPHNSYFNSLLELGPAGALLLAMAVSLLLGRALARRRGAFVAGLIGAGSAAAITSLFESGLTSPGSLLGFTFWFIVFAIGRVADLE